MKGLFIDTNIIIDVLANRKPYVESASLLFDLAIKGKATLFISALSYSNIYYIIRKTTTHRKLISVLEDLENITETLDVSRKIIGMALKSDFKDFEDAIQYETAASNKKVDAIVTRDPKGYQNSKITVLTPDEALTIVLSTSS